MLSRFFNKRQKQFLYTKAGGVCTICGIELTKGWHADHVVPWSKNGNTEIDNGQALCPKCNLIKNDKMINQNLELRKWQKEFVSLPFRDYKDNLKSFLLHAGVGSGKTIASIYAARLFIERGFNVVIISPSSNVKYKWSLDFHNNFIEIDYNYSLLYDYRRDGIIKGISFTYYILQYENNVNYLLNNIIDKNTLLILDEVHHLGDNKKWGDAIIQIGEKCGFVLSLTGTPYRSDDNKIPFATYEPTHDSETFKLKVDYSYSYGNSVKDKVCCPISFRSIDVIAPGCNGMLLNNELHNKIFNSALIVSENDFVYNMYQEADKLLDQLREIKYDAAGLIVCNKIEEAEALYEKIHGSILVTSDDYDGDEKIKQFVKSDDKWIISVKKISEGVDIPRLRVLVYAINITTPLFFTQVAGRIVRNRDDEEINTIDHGFFFYPNYEPLVNNAKQIESEIYHIVEEQENEIYNNSKNEYSEIGSSIDNPIYEVSSGEMNYINAGIEVNEIKFFEDKLTLGDYQRLERLFAVNKKANEINNSVINNTQTIPIVEQVKNKSKETWNIINIYVKKKYKDKAERDRMRMQIHYDLNKKCGINSKSDKHANIEKHNMKYREAKKLLNTIDKYND